MVFGQNAYGNSYVTPTYGTNNVGYNVMPTPVTPTYGVNQQYAAPAPIANQPISDAQNAIMVHGIEGARNYIVPKNSLVPLFDDEEDVFYIKTTDPDGMHQRIKKYRFYEEFDNGIVDTASNLIEQKDIQYGASGVAADELTTIKKSIEDLTGQINALVELQLEQSGGDSDSRTAQKTTSTKKTTNNK